MIIAFVSFGNDSIALLQRLVDLDRTDVTAVYSNTGWASPEWESRVNAARTWLGAHGFGFREVASEGLEALVRARKGWPRQGMQFCSYELKIKPAQRFLDVIDPDREATCCVGVRREESRARASWPEWIEESDNHGGRSLWSPLVRVTTAERDELIYRAGWTPLPTRSQECFPCINANRTDLRLLTEERVAEIEAIEESMGYTSKGNPRTMFRPYRHQGAVGIRQVWEWAKASRGQYEPPSSGCDSGMCAS